MGNPGRPGRDSWLANHADLAELAAAIVLDRAGFSVHQSFCAYHFSAKSRADRLMAETDSEQRNLAGKVADQFNADAGILRSARSGRNHDPFRPHRFNLVNADLVIAPNLNLSAQFAQVLTKVVGKRVVVVENEDHRLIV